MHLWYQNSAKNMVTYYILYYTILYYIILYYDFPSTLDYLQSRQNLKPIIHFLNGCFLHFNPFPDRLSCQWADKLCHKRKKDGAKQNSQ